jgi:hypothetical protein
MIAALVLGALVTAACTGGSANPTPPAASLDVPAPSTLPAPGTAPTVTPGEGSVPQVVIDAAIADAASRADVDPSAVTVISTEARTWPSGALGCPEPGYLYTDMLTPGYRVVVEAGGREYDYRATRRGQGDVRRCSRPPADDPPAADR